jgi:2-polyprenyl-6-methoxyphenol hydroxylase-like FAD-dependent oxidoreductase
VPWLAERLNAIENWQHVNVLVVEAQRVPRWHRPGLLLIGDTAHVMLPIAGVGINCAIADAVEAANVLVKPLRAGEVHDRDLARIQRRREWVTRIVQGFQAALQRRALQADADATTFVPPLPIRIIERLPGVRDLPARITVFGVRRVRVQHTKELPVV